MNYSLVGSYQVFVGTKLRPGMWDKAGGRMGRREGEGSKGIMACLALGHVCHGMDQYWYFETA